MGEFDFDDAELVRFYHGLNVFQLPARQRYLLMMAMPAVRAREELRESWEGLTPDSMLDKAMLAYNDEERAQDLAAALMQKLTEERSRSKEYSE